jgi:hypothetical protein
VGFEGVTPLPQRVTASDLIYVHTGVRHGGEAVAFGIVADDTPPGYTYELHGREVGWEELAESTRASAAVHLTRYWPNRIPLVAAGRPEDPQHLHPDPVARFGERIWLRDITVQCETTGGVEVAAVWQARTAIDTDVAVFAHLLPDGLAGDEPAAQADGYPMLGMRPFWFFLPDEALRDIRYFPPAPPGAYQVRVGLWEPASGKRWPADGTSDGTVLLPVECPPGGVPAAPHDG